jgi:hypothetical protein
MMEGVGGAPDEVAQARTVGHAGAGEDLATTPVGERPSSTGCRATWRSSPA